MAVGESGGRATSRYRRVGSGEPDAAPATWEDAEPDQLWRAIIAVTNAGDGITLSKTKDGGALSIAILTRGGQEKWYPRGELAVKNTLRDILISLEETADA